MLTVAVIIFAVTAIGGLVLANSVLRGKLAPWPVGIIHALLGASGLVIVLLLALQQSGDTQLLVGLGLLVTAALGGFYLFSLHIRKVVAPKPVVLIHAGVAIAGFLTLLGILL